MAGLTKAQPPKQCLFPSFFQHSEVAVATTAVAFSKLTDLHCHFYRHKSAEEKKKQPPRKGNLQRKACMKSTGFQVFKAAWLYGGGEKKNIEKLQHQPPWYIITLRST